MLPTLLRRVLLVLTTIVCLALALVLAVHLPPVRARVLEWAGEWASRELGIFIQAEGLRYNLWTMSLELRKPTMFSAAGERPFLQADSVRIVLNRRALRGILELERVELVRPRIVLVRHRDGTTNLPSGPAQSSAAPEPLRLGIVAVSQMSLEAEDEAAGHRLAIGPLDLTVDSRSGDSRPGALGPGAFVVRIGGADPALAGTLAGRVGFDGTRFTVHELRIEAPEGRLALDGHVDLLAATPGIAARGQLDLDLARVQALVGAPGDSLAGSAVASFTIGGSLTDPTAHASVLGRDLRYRSVTADELSADVTYGSGRLAIGGLHVTSNVGAAEASGELILAPAADTTSAGHARARIIDLDLDRALGAAGFALPVAVGTRAAGDLDAVLEGAQPFAPDWLERLTVAASGRLIPTGAGLSVDGRFGLQLRSGQWRIDHDVRSSAASAHVSGAVSGAILRSADAGFATTLSGLSRARFDRIGALAAVLQEAGLALPPPLDAQSSGTIEATVEPRGTLAAPRVLVVATGRSIRLGDLPEGELDADIRIDRRAVLAQSLEARVGTTRLEASGSVRLVWPDRRALRRDHRRSGGARPSV